MTWALGVFVAILAAAGLALPWWWTPFAQRKGLRRRSANVAAYRTRLDEMSADVAGGILAQEAVEGTKAELAARLLQDADAPEPAPLQARPSRGLLAAVTVALVGFAAVWYVAAGSWRTQALVALSRTDPERARAEAADAMVAQLRERVAQSPNDAEAWIWLGRAYARRGTWTEAAQALGRANAIKAGQDPDLLVEEGEALAWGQGRSMAGEPAARFTQALALAPDHPQALWYSGIAALQAGDDRGAIALWERLSRQPMPDDVRAQLDHSLVQLRQRTGLPAGGASAPAGAADGAPAAGAFELSIEVSIAPELAAAVPAGATLFVFAQDPSGPPMPLAVQRLAAAELPARVRLDDSMGPMPTRKLSSVDRWRIVARISRGGTANPQPGDLEGSVEVARAAAGKPVRLTIDRRRP